MLKPTFPTVTEEEAIARGFTWITHFYKEGEYHLLSRSVSLMGDHLLVFVPKKGVQIWRPKNRVAIGEEH